MHLQRKRPDKPGVLTSCTKQRTCGARGLQCKTQNAKCTLLYTPAVPAVAGNTNDVDSAATQPKLRRMNASSDLSEYLAECSQSVESQCGNEAGAADSPDSAEHIWQAPLPDSAGSSNDGTSAESDVNTTEAGVADRFRRAARAIEERRSFITEYVVKSQRYGLCHRRYYIKGREVTEDYFELADKRSIEVISIGMPPMEWKTDTAVADV